MNKLKLSWEEFLKNYPFPLWVTLTFKHSTPAFIAKKKFKHFLKHLNDKQHYYEKFIRAWVFIDKDTIRDGIHLHAIIDGISPSKAPSLEQLCFDAFGQSKIMSTHENVIPYLAKKYNSAMDIDYIKVNSHFRKSRST